MRCDHDHAPPSLEGHLTRRQIVDAVEALFAAPQFKPPMLPTVAVEVIELSRRTDVSFDSVVKVIQSDPLFAASLLRVASSPIYASTTPLRSIQEALFRLGLQTLGDLCLEAALSGRVFRARGFDDVMEATRRHNVTVAHLARWLCKRVAAAAESSFMLGLLHDVGVQASIVALIGTRAVARDADVRSGFGAVLDARGEVGARVVRAWRLPLDLGQALASFHTGQAPASQAGAALILAERLANDCGRALPRFDGAREPAMAEQLPRAMDLLRLPMSELARLMLEARKVVETIG